MFWEFHEKLPELGSLKTGRKTFITNRHAVVYSKKFQVVLTQKIQIFADFIANKFGYKTTTFRLAEKKYPKFNGIFCYMTLTSRTHVVQIPVKKNRHWKDKPLS